MKRERREMNREGSVDACIAVSGALWDYSQIKSEGNHIRAGLSPVTLGYIQMRCLPGWYKLLDKVLKNGLE